MTNQTIRLSKYLMALFCCSLVGMPSVFAKIDVTTDAFPVSTSGNCEQGALIFLEISGNHFPMASPETPVYLKLQLDKEVKLGTTLVNVAQSEALGLDLGPIFLPLYMPENSGAIFDTLGAPADTLSIVRWVAGEDSIWLRVQRPTTTWIDTGGGTEAPTSSTPVRTMFSAEASRSWETLSGFHTEGRANLPFSTRDLSAGANTFSAAISTLLCLDMRESGVRPQPAPSDESIVNIELTLWRGPLDGLTSEADAVEFPQGLMVPATVTGDTEVASVVDIQCSGNWPLRDPVVTGPSTCGDPGGWVEQTQEFGFNVFCGSNRGVHHGSRFILTWPEEEPLYFEVAVDGEGNPIDASDVSGRADTVRLADAVFGGTTTSDGQFTAPYAERDHLRQVNGRWMAKGAEIMYQGVGESVEISADYSFTVSHPTNGETTDVVGNMQVLATGWDSSLDTDPRFSLPQQAIRCPPSYIEAFNGHTGDLAVFQGCE
ncbi:hypothetical protein SCOR_05175 [Sulfidibacter corallicola]|uniref:DNRLRE domain-containing protein n=1 Tax=Sulfidibacter corallicola TaxID=2818388 RepID=A0A8A4TZ97_SULCO|nr:hypothetical protein [Sulfidibacter corallicola]QTD51835.1 hypothetical protein J3U87_05135 [Sulfidibacter corallicola]